MSDSVTPSPIFARIEKLEPKLLALAKGYARTAFEADDIHSEIVLEIVKRSSPTDSDARILTVAKWAFYHMNEKNTTYTKYVGTEDALAFNAEDEQDADPFEYYMADSGNNEDAAMRNQQAADLQEALESLSAESQQLVRLLEQGYKPAEIAKKMKVSAPAISLRIDQLHPS